jgi:elongation factor P
MVIASEVKAGDALSIDGKTWRVLEAVRHAGSGQMHGFVELKLHDVRFNHFADRRFKQGERLEEVVLEKKQMEYLYADPDACWFMDPVSFEQIPVPRSAMGAALPFLKEGTMVPVELYAGEPMSVQIPKVVELTVTSTGPGVRGSQDNTTLKPATLENGVDVLVPQFVETGDRVRVDTERAKYLDRVTLKRV